MRLIHYIEGTNGDIQVNLTPDAINNFEDFKGCLVITIYNKNYVMTYHPKRGGWEFPAGRKEIGETPKECAKRETFEETGGILKNLHPIGYYIVRSKNEEFKTPIYIGDVERFEPKPSWSETGIVKLFDKLPNNVSYKDDVYKIVLDYIESRPVNDE